MTQATRTTQDSADAPTLYVALELSKNSWKLGFSDAHLGGERESRLTRPPSCGRIRLKARPASGSS